MADFPTRDDILSDDRGVYRKDLYRRGLQRATVVSVNDPQNRGRVQVRITLLHPASVPPGRQLDTPDEGNKTLLAPPGEGVPDDACPWAEPCFPWGGFRATAEDGLGNGEPTGLQTEGFFAMPSIGSTVWVGFDQGFTGRPIWLGSWLTKGTVPEEVTNPAYIRLFKTPAGHILLFDDTPGAEKVFLATFSQDSADVPHTVRRIELDDAAKTVTITNTSNPATDPREIKQEETAKKTTITEGMDRKLELDQAGTKNTLQQDALQQIIQDGAVSSTTVKNSATQTISQDAVSGTTTITEGTTTIVLNSTAGTVAVTNGTTTVTVDAAGGLSVIGPALAPISLGTAAVQGVCLASLITVVAAMVTKFNTHTHDTTVVVPAAGELQTPPVIGVDSSLTVLAKL